jgi:hypothetical protein
VFSPRTWLSAIEHVRVMRRWDEIGPVLADACGADRAARRRYRAAGLRMKHALDGVTLDLKPMFEKGPEVAGDILLDHLQNDMAGANQSAAKASAG